jgi:hypothetical protein
MGPIDILWKIGFVVVFSTLTYLLNLLSMKELKPTVAVFIYLQPVFATVFRRVWEKDELNMVKIVSAVLFSGVAVTAPNNAFKTKSKERKQPKKDHYPFFLSLNTFRKNMIQSMTGFGKAMQLPTKKITVEVKL